MMISRNYLNGLTIYQNSGLDCVVVGGPGGILVGLQYAQDTAVRNNCVEL